MLATSTLAEQRTVLNNISWKTFETILKETGDKRGYRFAYDQGMLEIMTPLFEHENPRIQSDRLIAILAEELGIEIKSAGSMTLKREDLERGIEPDNCYYVQNEPAVRSRQKLDLATDSPPDLAIEIDITNSSINKLGVYAALGVAELWRYDGIRLKFYQLQDDQYVESDFSLAFPILLSKDLLGFIEQSKTMGEIALLKSFRSWVREENIKQKFL